MAINVMDTDLFRGDFYAPKMRALFDERAVVESWLLFESTLAEVQGELGIIPSDAAAEIKAKASLDHVSFERIIEINSKTKLASVATIRAVAEVCDNNAGEYIHYGSCSPELFENTLAYRLGKAMDVLEEDLKVVQSHLNRLADEHRDTLMVDRSHGQQALPISFGFVCAVWSDAVGKDIERFQEARKRILMGTIKGAVGNYSSHFAISGEKCLEMEKMVLDRLGLIFNPISFRRHMERLTEFMNLLVILAVTFEKICDDLFVQQRNEIAEVEEPFDVAHQIGSSTLPQKRNPVRIEAIETWCKKIRSNAAAFADTRHREAHDITGFYAEDLLIPETCVLASAMLNHAKYIFENLVVRKEGMLRNLHLSNGLVMTESMMIALTKKTGRKQTAHHIIHTVAMEAFEKNIPFKELILENPEIYEYLSKEEIEKLLDPKSYLGLNDHCIDAVIK